jgi:hypothetical protein
MEEETYLRLMGEQINENVIISTDDQLMDNRSC